LDTNEKKVTLVAGLHRLEAVKKLGGTVIEARLVSDDDLEVELMEIDENLCRAELTAAQQAAAMTRRKEIYLALHPETAKGKAQAVGMNAKLQRGDVSEKFALTFTAATAEISGKSPRAMELAVARGKAIKPEKLAKIVGTSLDKGTELDALAKTPSAKREELIERAVRGEGVSARAELGAVQSASIQTEPIEPPSPKELEEIQLRNLEGAWDAACDSVRVTFGFEVLGLGAAAYSLPKQSKVMNCPSG
jgi:ParB-like chromosome segregation protein Spo0J